MGPGVGMNKTAFAVAAVLTAAAPAALADGFGDGVAAYAGQHYDTAAAIWRPLADDGEARAQYRLGQLYERGHGVEADPAVAAEWYGQAAAQGHAKAQYSLANLYARGEGVVRDPNAALAWFNRSALAGEPRAQYHLGLIHLNGDLVERDLVQAYVWFSRAAQTFSDGDERQRAEHAQTSLRAAMDTGQQQAADAALAPVPAVEPPA